MDLDLCTHLCVHMYVYEFLFFFYSTNKPMHNSYKVKPFIVNE